MKLCLLLKKMVTIFFFFFFCLANKRFIFSFSEIGHKDWNIVIGGKKQRKGKRKRMKRDEIKKSKS